MPAGPDSAAPAFEALYRLNADWVYRLCLRLSGDSDCAMDLAQDVFVRAWEKRHLWPPEPDRTRWLWTVAQNVVRNGLRSDRRRRARVEPVEQPSQQVPVTQRTPVWIQGMDLEQAIAELPTGARRIFVRHEIEGYSNREVARELGIRSGSVRAQLFRARRLLAARLAR
jgi:RNA polymerase sigma-70 factor (ECF subfamily)